MILIMTNDDTLVDNATIAFCIILLLSSIILLSTDDLIFHLHQETKNRLCWTTANEPRIQRVRLKRLAPIEIGRP